MSDKRSDSKGIVKTYMPYVHSGLSLLALFLSFKRNDGFDFGAFIMACCCPYIYIMYYLATM